MAVARVVMFLGGAAVSGCAVAVTAEDHTDSPSLSLSVRTRYSQVQPSSIQS
ncbi:hypothetical protein ACFC00_04130 [Streptomyces adustus]|uniref:hypothetical protein n=1 Tax=Streptomyces adustus TaxID=1609272 RepID=UPI0035DD337E